MLNVHVSWINVLLFGNKADWKLFQVNVLKPMV